MVDLETATIQLYEDASLTEDLHDEEAKLLLKWGETQLKPLVEKFADDEEGFDGSFKEVRRFIKAVNRYVGRRQDSAPDEQKEFLAKVIEAAQGINPDVRTEAVESFAQAQTAQSNMQLIESLISWVSPPAPMSSSAPPPPALPSPDSHTPKQSPENDDDDENKPKLKPLW